jgi:lipopolysaccharide export system protein LptC
MEPDRMTSADGDIPAQGGAPSNAPPRPRGATIPISVGRRRFNRSYGRAVGWMKILLPTTAVVLVSMIFVWPYLEEEGQRIIDAIITDSPVLPELMEVNQARYSGVGEDGQRYTVTAETVRQETMDATLVEFEGPRADISLSDGTWALVSAERGTFDRDTQVLELNNDVSVFHDLGYEFRTESATLDLMGGSAYGFDPVEGQGPFGFVEAEGFEMIDRGARVRLTGKSRVVINNTD